MKGAKGAAVIGFAAALLLGYVLWERALSPGARARRTLEGAAAAAESVDLEAFLSFLSSDYSDFMHPERAAFEGALEESFQRVDRMNVTLDSMEIEVQGSEARASFGAVVVAIRGEERLVVVGQPFQPERFQAYLRREDGGWRIRRVELLTP